MELEATPPEVKQYQRLKVTAALLSLAGSLIYLTVMALVVGPMVDRSLPDWISGNGWVKLLVLATLYGVGLELLLLPLDFWASFIVEHRYQLSNQTFLAWLRQRALSYLLGGLLGIVALGGLYGFLWFAGWWWWIGATAAWLAMSVVLGQLLPVLILPLFYKVTRLEDAGLIERLRKLTIGTGLTIQGVYRLHLSAETKKANAALAGLGRTRRVLLGDTLLDQFTPEEIEVVFAHEVGHHVFRHILILIAGNVLVVAATLFLLNATLHQVTPLLYGKPFTDPAALPLLLLFFVLFGLPLGPIKNAVSRVFERQCDRYALERTGLRDAFRSAFIKLAKLNKSDPDPHPLIVWLLYDHPPIRERLALAEVQGSVILP